MENQEKTQEERDLTALEQHKAKMASMHGSHMHWVKALIVIIILGGIFSLGAMAVRWHDQNRLGFYGKAGTVQVFGNSTMMGGRQESTEVEGGVSSGTVRMMGGRTGMMGRSYSGSGTIQTSNDESILVGGVASINGNTIVIRSNSTNITVNVSSSTSFYKNGTVAKQSDLQIGDIVNVVGKSDSNGVVTATSVNIQ